MPINNLKNTTNKLQELRAVSALKKQKNPNRAVVSIKGIFSSSRVIQAKFPHAEDSPFVRLSLSHITMHSFSVVEEIHKLDNSDQELVKDYLLCCSCLATGRGSENRVPDSYLIATFYSLEHAEEALAALEKSMNSKRRYWVMGAVAALTWAVLFMPMSSNTNNTGSNSRIQSSGSAASMGTRIAPSSTQLNQLNQISQSMGRPSSNGGLQIPQVPSLGSLGILQAPGINGINGLSGSGTQGSPLTPDAPGTISAGTGALANPTAQPTQSIAPTQRSAGPEDDPFGLKISPSGPIPPIPPIPPIQPTTPAPATQR